MRFILIVFSIALCAAPSIAQTTGVSGINDFTINGSGSGATSPVDPALNNLVTSITMSVSAAPGDSVVGASSNVAMPGVAPVSASHSLDLNPAMLNIFIQPGSALGFPINTTVPASGSWDLSLPVTLGAGSSYAIQYALVGPGFAAGIGLTQAHAGSVASIPQTASVYSNTVGGDLSPLSDDGNVMVTLANPAGFAFYGTSHTAIYVNMNGNMTFVSADSDFSPSESEMLSDQARIAIAWDDWTPSDLNQGTVRVFDDGTTFEIEWYDVRHFGTTTCGGGVDSNTFGAQLTYATGQIEMKHQLMLRCTLGTTPSSTQLVGIGPGASLSLANNVDLSTPGGMTAVNAMDAIYEDFTLSAYSPSFDLGHWAGTPSTETTITFLGSGGAGVGPYLIF